MEERVKPRKAYAYLRVSTLGQVDGMSLKGQQTDIENYCKAYHIELVRIYSDEGRSGKTIDGRPQFQAMLHDIKEKQEVDCVIVWKLSRFGRNATDSLNSFEYLKRYNITLIAIKESIDTSTQQGKGMFQLLSAIAEMERENILIQTANGKKYNAKDGNWNGGQAPYGYKLVNKKLVIEEEEARIVRKIFEYFLETDCGGYHGVTARLNDEKIKPRQTLRLDRKAMRESSSDENIYLPVQEDWSSSNVKKILDNPVYYGKIRYGNTKIVWKEGKTCRERNNNPILVDGKHEAIITEEIWSRAQKKREKTGIKFPSRDSKSPEVRNIFNRIAKCPQCGAGMVSCQGQHKNKDGTHKIYYQYICGYYNNHKHGKCRKNMIRAEYLEKEVFEVLTEYVNRPDIMREIANYLEAELDTRNLDMEIGKLERKIKELDKSENIQYNILAQVGLDGPYKHLKSEKVADNINKIISERGYIEELLLSKRFEKEAIEMNRLNYELIKELLENFSEACAVATREQQRGLIRSLVKEIKLGYHPKTKKVVPVSMTLNITGEQIEFMGENSGMFGLDEKTVETVCLLSRIK